MLKKDKLDNQLNHIKMMEENRFDRIEHKDNATYANQNFILNRLENRIPGDEETA